MGWPTEREFQGHGATVVVDRSNDLSKRTGKPDTGRRVAGNLIVKDR